jgi:hypothetical protein
VVGEGDSYDEALSDVESAKDVGVSYSTPCRRVQLADCATGHGEAQNVQRLPRKPPALQPGRRREGQELLDDGEVARARVLRGAGVFDTVPRFSSPSRCCANGPPRRFESRRNRP